MDELCDQCGGPLGDDPIFDNWEMTQFCCEECADNWVLEEAEHG